MSEVVLEPQQPLLHVIESEEAETYFSHGAQLLNYDAFSDSYFFEVPYMGHQVIRQNFEVSNNDNSSKKNFEKFLMKYYCCLWASISIPPIVGVSKGNFTPHFIIYDICKMVSLHDAMRHAQLKYSQLDDHLTFADSSIWTLLSQRHGVMLEAELLHSDIQFVKEPNDTATQNLWTALVERLNSSIQKLRDEFGAWNPR